MPRGVYVRSPEYREKQHLSQLGHRPYTATHGMSKSPVYKSWDSMIQRCRNPKAPDYSHYGGRGISVCDRWLKFENFLADMGERPAGTTLDRINNDGNYEPGNCRWATAEIQTTNRRPFVNPQTLRSHCPHGHAYDEANTRWYQGRRYCRTCNQEKNARERLAKKALL